MNKQDNKEWQAEKKLRKAVKKMIKIKPTMLDFNTHKYVNGKKYFIRIWSEGNTILQIAEALSVCDKTVTRAIAGKPRIRPILKYEGEE